MNIKKSKTHRPFGTHSNGTHRLCPQKHLIQEVVASETLTILALVLDAQKNSTRPTTVTGTCDPQTGVVDFRGRVLDGSGDDAQGSPIGLAEIQTQPVIWNVNLTDSDGRFHTPTDLGICLGTEYTFTAWKFGYEDRRIRAVAQRGEVNVNFLMTRDTASFAFPTVRVLTEATSSLVAGANISFSAGGSNRTFQTSSTGQTSVPFPKNSVVAVAVQRTGFRDLSFDYNVVSGIAENVNGGRVQSGNGIITAFLLAQ